MSHCNVLSSLLLDCTCTLCKLSCRCPKSPQSRCEDDAEEQTCLHWAYERGHDEIITLLKHFRRPDTETRQGDYTPSGEGEVAEGCHVIIHMLRERRLVCPCTVSAGQDSQHYKGEN